MQHLDDVGSVFGSPDFPIAKRLMKIMNPEYNEKVQVAEELQDKKNFRC